MKQFILPAFLVLLAACGSPGPSSESVKQPEKTSGTTETTEVEAPEESGPPAVPAIPADARVFFVNLEDGATVTSPVHIEMGVEGLEVEPAGAVNEGKGHHHLLINEEPAETGVVVPADDTHIHYGQGQTETDLELEPGTYTLTLQFADGWHRSYGLQMSASVQVTVTE